MTHALAILPEPEQDAPAPAAVFVVTGRNGTLTVDARTGDVLSALGFDHPDAYSGIIRIDVIEWVDFWQSDPAGAQLDLSDVAYWNSEGYRAADAEWREAVRPVREARRERTGSAVINKIKP